MGVLFFDVLYENGAYMHGFIKKTVFIGCAY